MTRSYIKVKDRGIPPKCAHPRCSNQVVWNYKKTRFDECCSQSCASSLRNSRYPELYANNYHKMLDVVHSKYNHQDWSWMNEEQRRILYYFEKVCKRTKESGLKSDYSYNKEGFLAFADDIGSIPVDMIRPTVGRINHDLGYIQGNFKWQEYEENCRENAVRNQSILIASRI